ncbi:MAG: fibronectin type III domain-containing protein [Candidatus Microsaccharimonas sp.]
MSMSKRGFTLVELVVVIAVIGILAAITLIGFSRYQADGRDARRATSVSAISEALEKYYDQNGEYPSCSEVTAIASVVTGSTLQGLSAKTLVAPQATGGTTNSLQCGATLTINGVDFFSYSGDGSAACDGSISCLNYSISYKNEGDGTVTTVNSRRNTALATSGAATLSAGTLGFTTAAFSWTSVQNAANYTLQVATTSNFTGGTYTEYPVTSATNTVATSLSAATNYWARVRPTNTVGDGLWSNVLPFTTNNITAPTVTTVANSNTQITVNWGAVTNADTYTLQYSLNSGMSSPITITGIVGTTRALTGLTTGTTYYIQVRGVSTAPYQGNWSSVVDETTIVPAPASISVTVNSTSQITVSWASVSVADTYRLQRSTNNFSTVAQTYSDQTAISQVITGLQQGQTHYFRVYALVGTTLSNSPSPTGSGTTGVDAPGATEFWASRDGTTGNTGWGNYWLPGQNFSEGPGNYYQARGVVGIACPSGTSPEYYMSGYYNSGGGGPYNSGWTGIRDWHLMSPNSPYQAIFRAYGRCLGPSGVYSGQSDYGTRCVRYNGAAC